jgi:hypothetical protein
MGFGVVTAFAILVSNHGGCVALIHPTSSVAGRVDKAEWSSLAAQTKLMPFG